MAEQLSFSKRDQVFRGRRSKHQLFSIRRYFHVNLRLHGRPTRGFSQRDDAVTGRELLDADGRAGRLEFSGTAMPIVGHATEDKPAVLKWLSRTEAVDALRSHVRIDAPVYELA